MSIVSLELDCFIVGWSILSFFYYCMLIDIHFLCHGAGWQFNTEHKNVLDIINFFTFHLQIVSCNISCTSPFARLMLFVSIFPTLSFLLSFSLCASPADSLWASPTFPVNSHRFSSSQCSRREKPYLFPRAFPSHSTLTRSQLSSALQLQHYIIIMVYMQRSTLFNSRAWIVKGKDRLPFVL